SEVWVDTTSSLAFTFYGFISQIPLSNGYDAILVITTCTSLELADLFIEHVFLKDGLPDNIVSNRGSLFVSSFWTFFFQHLKI
ncbi:uncharacterized protein VP01_12289g2, partial [Puccinia sorghi]